MPRIDLPLATSLTRGRSSVAGMAGLVNCFAEPVKDGRAGIAIYPMPGRTLFSTIGGGTVRGNFDFGAYHVVVIGTRLYTIEADGAETNRGEIEGSDQNDLDYNGSQLFIQGTIKSYAYNPSTAVLAEVVDSDFLGASSVCAMNKRFITTVPNSDRFQWFDLSSGSSVDALDFATADSNGDINIAARAANETLHLFGEKTVQFFYNSGNPDQQFESRSIRPLEIGCLARDSIKLMDTGFNWVGTDGRSGGVGVYRMTGFEARKISTPAVDRFLEEYPIANRRLIHAVPVQWHAHQFYVLTLPGSVTLVYDQATGEWPGYLKSGTYPINEDPLGGWDAIGMAVNNGKRIVGAADGNLYELDDSNAENGEPIVREIITQQVSFPGDRGAIIHRIGVDMEVGVGLATGQGSDPKMMAAISKNGGKTWRALPDRGIGAVGKYLTNVFWTRQGQAENLMMKQRVTDPVFFAAFSSFADVEPLA